MRSSRRTTALRTAAVVTGAVAVLALPVGSAVAESPTAPPVTPPVKERVFLTTVTLADGSVATVYRVGDRHFEADVLAGGTGLDTLVSKGGKRAHGQNNGLHVVLRPNGTVTSWIEGGVKAGAEGVDTAPKTDTPVLLAAGGGMAAVGAAGLGFAVLGRGRG